MISIKAKCRPSRSSGLCTASQSPFFDDGGRKKKTPERKRNATPKIHNPSTTPTPPGRRLTDPFSGLFHTSPVTPAGRAAVQLGLVRPVLVPLLPRDFHARPSDKRSLRATTANGDEGCYYGSHEVVWRLARASLSVAFRTPPSPLVRLMQFTTSIFLSLARRAGIFRFPPADVKAHAFAASVAHFSLV